MSDKMMELIAKEIQFCEEADCEKNEHGVFIYTSTNGASSMNLPFILLDYKDWLIEKGIVTVKK